MPAQAPERRLLIVEDKEKNLRAREGTRNSQATTLLVQIVVRAK